MNPFLYLFITYAFQCVALHAKLYDENSEHDAVRGFICFSRRPNYIVTGMIPAE